MDASDNQNGISGDTAFHNGEGGLKGVCSMISSVVPAASGTDKE